MRSRNERRRDLLIFLSQGVAVSAFVFPGMYADYRIWLFLTGAKPGDAVGAATALLFGATVIGAMAMSGGLAGLLWAVVARRWLTRAEMEKWLNYGLDSAPLRKWNARLVHWLYRA